MSRTTEAKVRERFREMLAHPSQTFEAFRFEEVAFLLSLVDELRKDAARLDWMNTRCEEISDTALTGGDFDNRE